MKIETVCDNQWLSLKKMVWPEQGINGYVFSHETRCNGKIISILPYKVESNSSAVGYEYMLRKETTPCWHPTKKLTSSITGGVENDDPLTTAVHELKEEAGYEVTPEEMIFLGTVRGTKSSDTVYYLYAVDLTDKERGEATGDGSELEKQAFCYWAKYAGITQAEDPMVYVAYVKLTEYLRELEYNKRISK